MEPSHEPPERLALDRAISVANGKTALMRALNERGWDIGGQATIGQWQKNGIPEKYCPDIEDLTGVPCEQLCPGPNWSVLRAKRKQRKTAAA